VNSELEVWLHDATLSNDICVGTLARAAGRGQEIIRFTYSPEWLDPRQKRGFQIDPEIPLTPGAHFPTGGRSLHGVFRDTAPDRWGRVLMERREAMDAKAQKRPMKRLSEWDFLVGVNDHTRMGALRLWDASKLSYVDDRALGAPPAARLRELEAIVRALDADDAESRPEYEQWLRLLVVPGTSLGGARPKASFIEADGTLWLAKFPAGDDRRDVGAWEYLAYRLALKARIDMPEAKLMRFAHRHHTFSVKRFDRAGGARRLYTSAMTLLQRNDGDTGSYIEQLAQAIDPGR
jgi:serine/threonine-protein kinase HipA